MRRSKSHGSQNQPAGRRDHWSTKCSLCGRRRSSRISDIGPDDIVDQFICSRRDCGRFKDLLMHLSSPRPVVQINHYNGNSAGGPAGDSDPIRPAMGRESSQNGLSTTEDYPHLLAELPGYSSLGGRVEMPGDLPQTPPRSYGSSHDRRQIGSMTPPPPVNYAAKPKARR